MSKEFGWIKLHKKMSEKAYYKKDSEKVHLWLHLLILASHPTRQEMLGGKIITCKSGQFTIGRKQLSNQTGICDSKIERILTYFEKIEHQIEQRKTNKNRLIIIKKWADYQISEQQNEQQPNNNRTTTEQQSEHTLRISKNINNIVNLNKEKNNFENEESNIRSIGNNSQESNFLSERLRKKREAK